MKWDYFTRKELVRLLVKILLIFKFLQFYNGVDLILCMTNKQYTTKADK